MPLQCPHCGHPTRLGAKFCPNCGRPIVSVPFGSGQVIQLSQTRDVVRIMTFWEILIGSVRLFIRYFFRLFLAGLVGYAVWALMAISLLAISRLLALDDAPFLLGIGVLIIGLLIAVINALLTLTVSSLVLADRISYANLAASIFGRRLVYLLFTLALQSLLVFLGILLLIIPGIYLAVAFSMTPANVMLEERVGWDALRRSRELVRRHWWKTIGLLLVSLFIPVATFLIVIAAVFTIASGSMVTELSLIGASILFIVAVPCFSAVVQVLLYYDLRSRRGNFNAKSLITMPTMRMILDRI